jgi:acetoin utilization protein AcuB
MLVKNWMRRSAITVEPETGVKTAFSLLKKHRIRQLPVVKDGMLVGIVTDRDLRKPELPVVFSTSGSGPYKLEDRVKVGDIMTMEVITVTENTPIEEAVNLLLKHKINGLPIVSTDGRLSGIITTSDILGAFMWFCKYEKKT